MKFLEFFEFRISNFKSIYKWWYCKWYKWNNGKQQHISNSDRIEILIKTIKEELLKSYESFIVKIIQIYYNDNYDVYQPIKDEVITNKVCI